MVKELIPIGNRAVKQAGVNVPGLSGPTGSGYGQSRTMNQRERNCRQLSRLPNATPP